MNRHKRMPPLATGPWNGARVAGRGACISNALHTLERSKPSSHAGYGLLIAAVALAVSSVIRADGLTVLHAFDYADGQYPEGRLVQGADGRIYGTTYAGGVNGYGTVFAVTSSGDFSLLHSFSGSDGESLNSGLTELSDGNLYGSTPQGVSQIGGVFTSFGGTIFQATPQGAFTTLDTFPLPDQGDGYQPGTLVDGGDGFLYGTMATGGANGVGSVFKVSVDGSFYTVHAFTVVEGAYPGNGLTHGSDGKFYGVLQYGPGNNAHGAIFSVTPTGMVILLHTFNGQDGSAPGWGLAETSPGTFYGVTGGGGAGKAGTVFRMDAGGTLTTVHAFNGFDGHGPASGLALGPDGKLYGLTSGGGLDGYGSIFRMTVSAQFTTLRLLSSSDGAHPSAAPIFGSDGMLYGSTNEYGGAPGASGSVFRFDALSPQPATLAMSKTCYNEFDICSTPFNTAVGQRYSVQWSSANLTSCEAGGAWSGAKPTGGQIMVTATRAGIFVYQLRCRSAEAVRTASVTVSVI
jgi:uncharacterized repeat protein (TIGR03803 family)